MDWFFIGLRIISVARNDDDVQLATGTIELDKFQDDSDSDDGEGTPLNRHLLFFLLLQLNMPLMLM